MKWKFAARQVIDNLASRELITLVQQHDLTSLIAEGKAGEAFHSLHQTMSRAGRSVGWNKLWEPDCVRGWYGPYVLQIPLRAVVCEAESDYNLCVKVRQYLHTLWELNTNQVEPVQQSAAATWLDSIGISNFGKSLNKPGLTFLRRLNLNLRDQPFVERWHWSGGMGLAILSDGGRFQLRRESVWARAIESGLLPDGKLGPRFVDFLAAIEPEASELIIETGNPEDERIFENCISIIETYGFGKRLHDRIVLNDTAGGFPQEALRLWR